MNSDDGRQFRMRLTDFKVLTFDCYGTLIDWESGIHTALQPLHRAAGASLPRDGLLQIFARHESEQERQTPDMIYSAVLAEVHRRMAHEFGVAMPEDRHHAFGASVPDWPAFPDTVHALQYLKQHYRLVILSNVDRQSFVGSSRRLSVEFDAVYTAQDIGSYKPDPANFRYMLDHLDRSGIQPATILHTAQSLFHDHAPAKAMGLASAWIDRRHADGGWGATMPQVDASYDFRFISLAAMAAAHREESQG